MAVIFGKVDVTKILLENGAKVNELDVNGWTALHHAMILGNEEIIKLLKDNGAADDILDFRNGTAADLYHMVHGKVDPMAQHFFYRKKEEREVREGTGADFYALTGKKLSTEMLFSGEDLYYDWSRYFGRSPTEPRGFALAFTAGYGEVCQKMMRSSGADSPCFLEAEKASGGFTVRARRAIKSGEIVALYTGHGVPVALSDGEREKRRQKVCLEEPTLYDAVGIFNHDRRCIASFKDDSFPNVIACPVINVLGLAQMTAHIAFEAIREGDKICRHYSANHSVKLNPRLELRPKAMFRFAEEYLSNLDSCDRKLKDKRVSDLEKVGLQTQLEYLFTTKISLFQLFAKGSISMVNIVILGKVLEPVIAGASRPDIIVLDSAICIIINKLNRFEVCAKPKALEAYKAAKMELLKKLESKAYSLAEVLVCLAEFAEKFVS